MGYDFTKANERLTAAGEAGQTFESQLASMADSLSDTAGEGSSLGTMVKTQLELTEEETTYAVTKGLPEKATKTVSQVGQKISQAAGQVLLV